MDDKINDSMYEKDEFAFDENEFKIDTEDDIFKSGTSSGREINTKKEEISEIKEGIKQAIEYNKEEYKQNKNTAFKKTNTLTTVFGVLILILFIATFIVGIGNIGKADENNPVLYVLVGVLFLSVIIFVFGVRGVEKKYLKKPTGDVEERIAEVTAIAVSSQTEKGSVVEITYKVAIMVDGVEIKTYSKAYLSVGTKVKVLSKRGSNIWYIDLG